MRSLTIDQVAGGALAAFSVLVLWESRTIPLGFLAEPGPGVVPILLACALLACSVALVAGGRGSARLAEVSWSEWRHAVAILAACAFMALTIERIGYRLTIFITLLVLAGAVEKKGWVAATIFAGAFSAGTYFLFNTLLKLPLPTGPFGI